VNTVLALATLPIVIAFQRSDRLASAYGVAVCGDMLLTSIFYVCVCIFCWRVPAWRVVAYVLIFTPIDVALLASNLTKVATGG
jgi:KUP system potassium uptake protein